MNNPLAAKKSFHTTSVPRLRPRSNSHMVVRLKNSSSFKITLTRTKKPEKKNLLLSSSSNIIDILKEVAKVHSNPNVPHPNPKKMVQVNIKSSLISSVVEPSSKILRTSKQKDDSRLDGSFLAVQRIVEKYQHQPTVMQGSDTVASFFTNPGVQDSVVALPVRIPFYLDGRDYKAKGNKFKLVQTSSVDPKSPYDSCERQKAEKLDETKNQLKPFRLYNNYRHGSFTYRDFDQCTSRELIDMICSKEKSSIINVKEQLSPMKQNDLKRDKTHRDLMKRALSTPRPRVGSSGYLEKEVKIRLRKAVVQKEMSQFANTVRASRNSVVETALFRNTVLQQIGEVEEDKKENQKVVRKKQGRYVCSWSQITEQDQEKHLTTQNKTEPQMNARQIMVPMKNSDTEKE